MSLEIFEAFKFQPKTLTLIERANEIIGAYQVRGFVLTLRQLFYQFVAKVWLANKQSEYKRLGTIIASARRAGLVDWAAIEDRTRNVHRLASWVNPSEIVDAIAEQYREDRWEGQPFLPEVWIEKESLIGVIEVICNQFRVPYFACRGNNSESNQYEAGKRFESALRSGRIPMVLHLGDHDPSGLDMTRDNKERLELFARQRVEVRRLALNMDQIEQYRLPPNPAKEADSRFDAYVKQYGRASWELDALDPTVISDLIRTELRGLIDHEAWETAEVKEATNRDLLVKTSENWALVASYVARLQ